MYIQRFNNETGHYTGTLSECVQDCICASGEMHGLNREMEWLAKQIAAIKNMGDSTTIMEARLQDLGRDFEHHRDVLEALKNEMDRLTALQSYTENN